MQQQVRGKQASSKCTLFLEDISLAKEPLLQVSKLLQHWLDLAVEAGKAFENNIEQLDKNEVFILSEWHYWIREMKLRIAEWEEIFLYIRTIILFGLNLIYAVSLAVYTFIKASECDANY